MKFPQNASLKGGMKDVHGKMWSWELLPQQLHSVVAYRSTETTEGIGEICNNCT